MAKKAKARKLTTKQTSYLAPERLYTRDGFMRAAGLSMSRLSDARHDHGLVPKWLTVGAKQFIDGTDAIAFIKQLAAAEAAEKERRNRTE